MKLNNKGWGMREMIIYMCILAFLLLLAAYMINSLYNNVSTNYNNNNVVTESTNTLIEKEDNNTQPVTENTINYDYYHNLETKLYNATLNYLNDYQTDLEHDILNITSDDLIGLNYIEELYNDNSSSKCSGFSNVYKENDEYVIKSYINCGEYVTEGYFGGSNNG